MERAVFLDRDGTINEIIYHQDIGIIDTPFTMEQFRLLPHVAEAISLINRMGYKVIVVSNQPGVARGHFTKETLFQIDLKMKEELAARGAFIDASYYCPHAPDGVIPKYSKRCNCRKPKPGLLLKAARELNIDCSHSFMIGDSLTDVQAGHSVGAKTILLGRMKCTLCRLMQEEGIYPDFICADLLAAVQKIKEVEDGGIYRHSQHLGDQKVVGLRHYRWGDHQSQHNAQGRDL